MMPAALGEFKAADGAYTVRHRTALTMMDRLEYDTRAWQPYKINDAGEVERSIESPTALPLWLISRFAVDVVMKDGTTKPWGPLSLVELPDDGAPEGIAVRLAAHLHKMVQANIAAAEAEKKS